MPQDVQSRVAVITCAVLEMEIAEFAKSCPNVVHIELLEQGLHNEPGNLRTELQNAIIRVEREHNPTAIVLGYGLCSRGTVGVSAVNATLVIARAHDCITLLLGDRRRYADYVKNNPGTYWYSPGWNKHHLPPGQERYEKLYAEYAEKYGDDNAQFLMESEQHWFQAYDRATYVDLGIGVTDEDLAYTQKCADWLKWKCDREVGDPTLLKDLLTGPWDDDRFLVLGPGESLAMSGDDNIIQIHVPKDVSNHSTV
ncbi:MAG TPA: DUF1638 domain-containing protein [Capsulimonadaceae bacterium]